MDDDIFRWAEARVNRFIWLSHMSDVFEKSRRVRPGDNEIYDFITNHHILLERLMRRMKDGSACPPGCGSLCCYFSDSYSTQVPIAEHERAALDRLLGNAGELSDKYYTIVPLERIEERVKKHISDRPGYVFNTDGVPAVCVLNPSQRKVDGRLLGHRPKTPKLLENIWTNEASKACRFLAEDNSCRLYHRLRFNVCHDYYCQTAFALLLLRHLGLAGDEILKRPMAELNGIAEGVAIAFRSKNLLGREQEFDSLFRELAIAYATGKDAKKEYQKLREFEKKYEKELMECLKNELKTG